ncbi:hypothetical protein BT63DRAFT_67470 [Microthyrium microscopicum]|uniref:Cyclic-AMP phosphodiesterase n=1 Tax=Microthyrium microscopicum TaxID=703497 RepID=A0A6A6U091_9PEZI|nr:hypothetical protein BT63DRAFT_67470 [Microthyrium microscopicum]
MARRRSTVEGPSLQVICLGSGGGPSEDNVSGLLVRSTSSKWGKGSILAVDAGSHLAAITRILNTHFPLVAPKRAVSETDSDSQGQETPDPGTILSEGPFAGLSFPHASARANAVHVVREHVSTYLITHPHMDHFSGFAINTACYHNTARPKRFAALPFTVNAIKTHIFNDIIWPNLTDEDSGVGLVTFQRLTEGGNVILGDGESSGYIEVCDGLAVKGFRVSHGTCASHPPHNPAPDPSRRGSIPNGSIPPDTPHWHPPAPRDPSHSTSVRTPISELTPRRLSAFNVSTPPTPYAPPQPPSVTQAQDAVVVDSSAYFIRAEPSGRQILVFGDVEPDSLSMLPRTHIVWAEAARKIAEGALAAVFIECSYSDSQPDAVLFGHLAPRHLIAELSVLAEMTVEARAEMAAAAGVAGTQTGLGVVGSPAKRKRMSMGDEGLLKRRPRGISGGLASSGLAISSGMAGVASLIAEGAPTLGAQPMSPPIPRREVSSGGPLQGLRVVVVHVKDSMEDGELPEECILAELKAHEMYNQSQGRGLGCDFEISKSGESYWF